MRSCKRLGVLASTMIALAGLTGCEESRPSASSSTAEAAVKGVVKVDGKPATEGEIIFDPSNYQRPVASRTAPIGKDGHYEIKTMTGMNLIKLGGPLARKSPILQAAKQTFEVQAGDNTFDFEAKAK